MMVVGPLTEVPVPVVVFVDSEIQQHPLCLRLMARGGGLDLSSQHRTSHFFGLQ